MKKTLILGATPNSSRYAYRAAQLLTENGHPIVPVGIKKGDVFGEKILNHKQTQEDIHTVTLYVSDKHQSEWYDYIFETAPERLIFNPGTENKELAELARSKGIEVVEGCTLVMLNVGTF
ncbi:MAG: CoA-binding protein [Thermonemataceae bacterium]